ncbi:hypothetical protein Y032_0106g3742 [Ancylostoma ceylanicum]|uniref:Uncharacterized protein n=1 Tax=Ancylostoma ceylanicum TaxID=53326 RepID=A0A016TF34_9BILA|nr:hypothetical protein Y032_0106g3742 [Ancylostoma ceylanicum]
MFELRPDKSTELVQVLEARVPPRSRRGDFVLRPTTKRLLSYLRSSVVGLGFISLGTSQPEHRLIRVHHLCFMRLERSLKLALSVHGCPFAAGKSGGALPGVQNKSTK